MHDNAVLVLYNSLGRALERLSSHDDVKVSPAFAEEVQTAILFHKEMEQELNSLVDDYQRKAKQLVDLQDTSTIVDTSKLLKLVRKYEHLRDLGATPMVIHKLSLDDHVSEWDQPRVLCTVFKFSRDEAQNVMLEYGKRRL